MSAQKIGRYEVVGELGRGAMGIVYKAMDPTIGRLVALKVLALEAREEKKNVASPQEIFMREARAAGRLAHPAIVTIHDAFEDPESHSSCIVMELVEGRTLEKILMTEPALPHDQALDIARQAAAALEYAHQHQVVHRDLKPANILLTADGHIKITDFGIAKITAREGAMRTVGVMGTPSYMSPEQVTGGDVDARSDLFSLGIILYLTLTGQKPFLGDTAAVMFKIVYEDPTPPSKLKTELGPGYDYVILHCLAKDRTKRYASARELLCDLEDLQHGRTPRSQATSPAAEITPEESTIRLGQPVVPPPQPAALPSPRPRPKWLTAVEVAALVALGIVLGVELRRFGGPTAPATPPPAVVTTAPATTESPTPASSVPAPTSVATSAPEKVAPSPPPSPVPEKTLGKVEEKPREAKSIRPTRVEPPAPASAAPTPSTTPSGPPQPAPAPKAAPPTRVARSDQVVELRCDFGFKEATLTVSSGDRIIWQGELKGKKRGGFLGIKGTYSGKLTRPVTIPGNAQQISVHVTNPEGVDLTGNIAAAPPTGPGPALRIQANPKELTLLWQTSEAGKP
jgi:serine/threonine protein kinase